MTIKVLVNAVTIKYFNSDKFVELGLEEDLIYITGTYTRKWIELDNIKIWLLTQVQLL